MPPLWTVPRRRRAGNRHPLRKWRKPARQATPLALRMDLGGWKPPLLEAIHALPHASLSGDGKTQEQEFDLTTTHSMFQGLWDRSPDLTEPWTAGGPCEWRTVKPARSAGLATALVYGARHRPEGGGLVRRGAEHPWRANVLSAVARSASAHPQIQRGRFRAGRLWAGKFPEDHGEHHGAEHSRVARTLRLRGGASRWIVRMPSGCHAKPQVPSPPGTLFLL